MQRAWKCAGALAFHVLLTRALPITAAQLPSTARLGEAAPPVTFFKVLQAPQGSSPSWEALRGKAVVLEFWATWCAGCVAHISKLNALADALKDQPIQFVSITDEEESGVIRFLQKYPIRGWVATNAKQDTFKAYRIQGIPRTILIDPDGAVQAMTNPDRINATLLRDLIARKKLALSEGENPNKEAAEPESEIPAPLIETVIRPAAPVAVSNYSPGSEETKGRQFKAWGLTLRDILSEAYQFPQSRIAAPEWCNAFRYDVTFVAPSDQESERRALMQSTLAQLFRLQIHKEPRPTDVFVLRTSQPENMKLRISTTNPGDSRPWGSVGEFDAVGAQIQDLTAILGIVLHSQVFDETALVGRYDFDLKWDPKRPASIIDAVREQLGLSLTPAQRELDWLIIDSAQDPQAQPRSP